MKRQGSSSSSSSSPFAVIVIITLAVIGNIEKERERRTKEKELVDTIYPQLTMGSRANVIEGQKEKNDFIFQKKTKPWQLGIIVRADRN